MNVLIGLTYAQVYVLLWVLRFMMTVNNNYSCRNKDVKTYIQEDSQEKAEKLDGIEIVLKVIRTRIDDIYALIGGCCALGYMIFDNSI